MIYLPPPVARYRVLLGDKGPGAIHTVAIETRAWMRRPGMPRIPLEIRMTHRLGEEFVHDIRIGRGRLSFRFGLDAYIGRHGLMKVGPSVQTGVEFDQGALIALWGEALGFPAAWESRTDVRWEPVDEHTARLIVQGPEGGIPITVGFDPTTGFPASCTADRYKATGPKVGWTGRYSDWRAFEGGVLAPGRFEVQWADEPYPWIKIETISLSANVPVADSLRLGRDAFRAAARRRRRAHHVMVAALKTIHTVIFAGELCAILWLVVSGLAGRRDRTVGVAAAAVAAEAVVFLANDGVCPITPLTERLGAAHGSVSDIFLPDAVARTTPIWSTALLVIAGLLHIRALSRSRR